MAAARNASELLIFGNPPKGHKRGCKCFACKNARGKKKNPGELVIFGNPSDLSASDQRGLTQLWHTARIAGANTFGERIRWAAKEWDKTHPGQRMRAYKWLSSAMRGYNPSTHPAKRATRERAARIRSARLNPGKMSVEFDNARKQFRATMRHPDGGSYLYAWGHTKKQAAHALRDQWRAARRKNPFDWRESRQSGGAVVDSIRHGDRVTILTPQGQQRTGRAVMRSSSGGWVLNMGGAHGTPGLADERNIVKVKKANPKDTLPAVIRKHQVAIAKATLRMPDAMVGVMGGMTKAQAREILKKKGNPREQVGEHQGVAMYFEGISYNAPALKLYGYSTDLALKRAIEKKLRKRQRANPRRRRDDRNPYRVHLGGRRYRHFETLEDARKFADEVARKTKTILSVEEYRKRKRNPDETRAAVRLFEKFHGRDPKDITEKHVSAAMRKDYTALGDLEHLKVVTPLGQTVQFDFVGDGVKLASSPDGKQLYCIGGNQNLSSCLDHASLEKDFIDLGEAVQVQYLARKVHANFEPVSYYHKFGEKTGERPQLAYDKLKRTIFFVGGNYFIDTKQGVSPGIEN